MEDIGGWVFTLWQVQNRHNWNSRDCLLAVYVFVQDYKLLGRAYLGETALCNSETNKDNHQICVHM